MDEQLTDEELSDTDEKLMVENESEEDELIEPILGDKARHGIGLERMRIPYPGLPGFHYTTRRHVRVQLLGIDSGDLELHLRYSIVETRAITIGCETAAMRLARRSSS
ncbi:hypothetical protein Bca101_057628 [Brassica carinata]